jgi:hypothetical protein
LQPWSRPLTWAYCSTANPRRGRTRRTRRFLESADARPGRA